MGRDEIHDRDDHDHGSRDPAQPTVAKSAMPHVPLRQLTKVFMDARPLAYIKIPEELGFCRFFDDDALQWKCADKSVSVESAIASTSVTKLGRWPRRKKAFQLKFMLALKLRNLTKQPVAVVLPRGTYWHSTLEWSQPLLLVHETRLSLKPGARMKLRLECFGGGASYYCPLRVPMELSKYQLVPNGACADALRGQYDLWRWLKPSLLVPIPRTEGGLVPIPRSAGPLASTLTERDRAFEERCAAGDAKAREAVALAPERVAAEAAALAAAHAVVEAEENRVAAEAARVRAEEAARHEEERKQRDARAQDEYAVVEIDTPRGRGVAGVLAADDGSAPDWFEELSVEEALAAVRADKLGDWAAFNTWLKAEYDEDECAASLNADSTNAIGILSRCADYC